MTEWLSRTSMLLGEDAMNNLASARVAVFGIGGVGGYVCEALARSGIGAFDLIDSDRISESNLNRQIIATRQTIGLLKVDVMKERILSVNPDAIVRTHTCFFLPDQAGQFNFGQYDYVIDAVDTVTAKIEIILRAQEADTPVISSMGTGNKLDPGRLRVADIYESEVCPLARVMRRELKKRGVKNLKVVYSTEPAIAPLSGSSEESEGRKKIPGSTAFVPSVAGLMIAGEVIKDLS